MCTHLLPHLWSLFTLVTHPPFTPLPHTTTALPSSHSDRPQFCGQSVFTQQVNGSLIFSLIPGRLRRNHGPCVGKSSCFHDPCSPHPQLYTHNLALVIFFCIYPFCGLKAPNSIILMTIRAHSNICRVMELEEILGNPICFPDNKIRN